LVCIELDQMLAIVGITPPPPVDTALEINVLLIRNLLTERWNMSTRDQITIAAIIKVEVKSQTKIIIIMTTVHCSVVSGT